MCVLMCICVCLYVTAFLLLSHASERFSLSLIRLFIAFRTKKNALETVLVGWLVLTAGLLSVTLD